VIFKRTSTCKPYPVAIGRRISLSPRDAVAFRSGSYIRRIPSELVKRGAKARFYWEIVLGSFYVGGSFLRAPRPKIVIQRTVSSVQNQITVGAVLQVLLYLAFDRGRKLSL
jgi:hypothetical protein